MLNRSRTFKKVSNGISFIDANHIFYVERIMAENRRKQGKELRALPLSLDMLETTTPFGNKWECAECGHEFHYEFGEFIPFKQLDVDEFEERWTCEVCINKNTNENYSKKENK